MCAMPTAYKQGSNRPSRSDSNGSCNKWWAERCIIALISYDYHNHVFDTLGETAGKIKVDWKKTAEEVNRKMRVTAHGPFTSDQVNSALVNSLEFPYDPTSSSKRRPRMDVDYPLLQDSSMRHATNKVLLQRCLIKCKGDLAILDLIELTLHEDFLERSDLRSILEVCMKNALESLRNMRFWQELHASTCIDEEEMDAEWMEAFRSARTARSGEDARYHLTPDRLELTSDIVTMLERNGANWKAQWVRFIPTVILTNALCLQVMHMCVAFPHISQSQAAAFVCAAQTYAQVILKGRFRLDCFEF